MKKICIIVHICYFACFYENMIHKKVFIIIFYCVYFFVSFIYFSGDNFFTQKTVNCSWLELVKFYVHTSGSRKIGLWRAMPRWISCMICSMFQYKGDVTKFLAKNIVHISWKVDQKWLKTLCHNLWTSPLILFRCPMRTSSKLNKKFLKNQIFCLALAISGSGSNHQNVLITSKS